MTSLSEEASTTKSLILIVVNIGLAAIISGLAYIANWEFNAILRLQETITIVDTRQHVNDDRIKLLEISERSSSVAAGAVLAKLATIEEQNKATAAAVDRILTRIDLPPSREFPDRRIPK